MKVVIPAAGLGTRFLPATKEMPKEMFPILDKPALEYILDEAVDSGMEEIIIIIRMGKEVIPKHFGSSYRDVPIRYIYQMHQDGLGHAVNIARNLIGTQPFAVMLGDDVMKSKVPVLKQMLDFRNSLESKGSIIATKAVPSYDVEKYGIVSTLNQNGNSFEISDLVEKPKLNEAPSNLAIMGRYILNPIVFAFLEGAQPRTHGEVQLTDAIRQMLNWTHIYALNFEGERFDLGSVDGFVKAQISYALDQPEYKESIADHFQEAWSD